MGHATLSGSTSFAVASDYSENANAAAHEAMPTHERMDSMVLSEGRRDAVGGQILTVAGFGERSMALENRNLFLHLIDDRLERLQR